MSTSVSQIIIADRDVNSESDQDWLGHPDRISASIKASVAAEESDQFETSQSFGYEAPPLDYRRSIPAHARFQSLQRWEGVVLEVGESEFTARLRDLTKPGVDEETSLFKDDVSQDDLNLLRPGAVFYLNIGYHTSVGGQRMRGMMIRFRRMPAWSADEILDARKRGQERLRKLVND